MIWMCVWPVLLTKLKLSTKYICDLGKSSLDKAKPKPASWLTCEGSGEGGRGGGARKEYKRVGERGIRGAREKVSLHGKKPGTGEPGGTRAP